MSGKVAFIYAGCVRVRVYTGDPGTTDRPEASVKGGESVRGGAPCDKPVQLTEGGGKTQRRSATTSGPPPMPVRQVIQELL